MLEPREGPSFRDVQGPDVAADAGDVTLAVAAAPIELFGGRATLIVANMNQRQNCATIRQRHVCDKLVLIRRASSVASSESDKNVPTRKRNRAAGNLANCVVGGAPLKSVIECAIGMY